MAGTDADDIAPPWHALPVEQVLPVEKVLRHFALVPQRGLGVGTVRYAQERHGSNALSEPPPKPLRRTFARRFKRPVIYILFVTAVLAVGLVHHGEAMVIPGVALVNALIGSFQERLAERSMAALRRLAALLLDTGRRGVQVTDESGAVLGFVSRIDLLRALGIRRWIYEDRVGHAVPKSTMTNFASIWTAPSPSSPCCC